MSPPELADVIAALSLLVAFAALFRPEWQAKIDRKRLRVSFHEAGRVEVGFGGFGPSIALYGAVHSSGISVLVRRITVELKHSHWDDPKVFSWTAFRSTNLLGLTQNLEVASAFVCPSNTEKKLHVFFTDKSIGEKHASQFRIARAQFVRFQSTFRPTNAMSDMGGFQAFDAFSRQNAGLLRNLSESLRSGFYWVPGDYRMRICVSTAGPDVDFLTEYKFSLTDLDVQSLRDNVDKTVVELVSGQNMLQYDFAYCAIVPVN